MKRVIILAGLMLALALAACQDNDDNTDDDISSNQNNNMENVNSNQYDNANNDSANNNENGHNDQTSNITNDVDFSEKGDIK